MGPGSRPGRQRRLSRLLSPHCQSCSRFKQQMRVHIPAAGYARVLREARPSNKKRAQGMPGEGFTHGPPATKKAGGSHHRISRIIRHSLRDGFTSYTHSPQGPAFLPLCRDNTRCALRSAPAPGRQDHTISPSVPAPVVCRHPHVHRSPPLRLVTTRTPLRMRRDELKEDTIFQR